MKQVITAAHQRLQESAASIRLKVTPGSGKYKWASLAYPIIETYAVTVDLYIEDYENDAGLDVDDIIKAAKKTMKEARMDPDTAGFQIVNQQGPGGGNPEVAFYGSLSDMFKLAKLRNKWEGGTDPLSYMEYMYAVKKK